MTENERRTLGRMARRSIEAQRGYHYPAWRDARRVTAAGPVLHAPTTYQVGDPLHSAFRALCGRPVRFKVEDRFDVDDEQSCLECAAAIIVANGRKTA